jgi:hypothetical protein
MTKYSTVFRGVLLVTTLCAANAGKPASAIELCASQIIAVRGEAASFQWLAKTKARANWRSRVRATKGLGEAYSSWNRAKVREERCETTPRGVVCTFTGTPCHR